MTPEDEGEPEIVVYEFRATHPDGFGGHVFEYDGYTDLFKCINPGCGVYEFIARADGGITQCPGATAASEGTP